MLIEMRNYLLRFLCFFNFECFLFVRIFSLYVQIVQIFQKKCRDWTDFYVQIISICFHHKCMDFSQSFGHTACVCNIQQFEALLKLSTTTCFFEIKNRHFKVIFEFWKCLLWPFKKV